MTEEIQSRYGYGSSLCTPLNPYSVSHILSQSPPTQPPPYHYQPLQIPPPPYPYSNPSVCYQQPPSPPYFPPPQTNYQLPPEILPPLCSYSNHPSQPAYTPSPYTSENFQTQQLYNHPLHHQPTPPYYQQPMENPPPSLYCNHFCPPPNTQPPHHTQPTFTLQQPQLNHHQYQQPTNPYSAPSGFHQQLPYETPPPPYNYSLPPCYHPLPVPVPNMESQLLHPYTLDEFSNQNQPHTNCLINVQGEEMDLVKEVLEERMVQGLNGYDRLPFGTPTTLEEGMTEFSVSIPQGTIYENVKHDYGQAKEFKNSALQVLATITECRDSYIDMTVSKTNSSDQGLEKPEFGKVFEQFIEEGKLNAVLCKHMKTSAEVIGPAMSSAELLAAAANTAEADAELREVEMVKDVHCIGPPSPTMVMESKSAIAGLFEENSTWYVSKGKNSGSKEVENVADKRVPLLLHLLTGLHIFPLKPLFLVKVQQGIPTELNVQSKSFHLASRYAWCVKSDVESCFQLLFEFWDSGGQYNCCMKGMSGNQLDNKLIKVLQFQNMEFELIEQGVNNHLLFCWADIDTSSNECGNSDINRSTSNVEGDDQVLKSNCWSKENFSNEAEHIQFSNVGSSMKVQEEIVRVFCEMHSIMIEPDDFTLGSIASSFENLAWLEDGDQLHCRTQVSGVKWVIEADKNKKIKFCCLQSKAAEPYMRVSGVDREDVLHRFLFIEDPGLYHQGSAAALRVLSYLPLPYSVLSSLMIVPAPLRDATYDYIAKRRYDWFGKEEKCLFLKETELLDRFIDRDEIMGNRQPDL